MRVALLTLLASQRNGLQVQQYWTTWSQWVVGELGPGGKRDDDAVMREVWALLAEGLAYIDMSQPHDYHWRLKLTEDGRAAAEGETTSPDLPDRYLQRLRERVPEASPTVMIYVTESVHSYIARCYLASAVMLGVASEAAFYEVAESFESWLSEPERASFRKTLQGRASYNEKYHKFRNQLLPKRAALPEDLCDNLELFLDGVWNQIRLYRNESGHPSGAHLNRDEAYTNLQLFPNYLKRMYGLKQHFDTPRS